MNNPIAFKEYAQLDPAAPTTIYGGIVSVTSHSLVASALLDMPFASVDNYRHIDNYTFQTLRLLQ